MPRPALRPPRIAAANSLLRRSRCAAASTTAYVLRRGPGSGRQARAALGTAGRENGTAGAGTHAQPEAVGLRAPAVVRLVGALAHVRVSVFMTSSARVVGPGALTCGAALTVGAASLRRWRRARPRDAEWPPQETANNCHLSKGAEVSRSRLRAPPLIPAPASSAGGLRPGQGLRPLDPPLTTRYRKPRADTRYERGRQRPPSNSTGLGRCGQRLKGCGQRC